MPTPMVTPAPARRAALSTLVAILAIGACSKLTEVDTSDVIEAEDVDTPFGAVSRAAGAIRTFAVSAMIPGTISSGVMSDELSAATNTATTIQADARRLPERGPTSGLQFTTYNGLHQARVNLLDAADAMKIYSPTSRGL